MSDDCIRQLDPATRKLLDDREELRRRLVEEWAEADPACPQWKSIDNLLDSDLALNQFHRYLRDVLDECDDGVFERTKLGTLARCWWRDVPVHIVGMLLNEGASIVEAKP